MTINNVRLKALEVRNKIISLRRELHKYPELGFEEFKTSSLISEFLSDLGLEVQTGLAKTGVMGVLRGKSEGKTLAIRADIDALPITEQNTFEYVSLNKGKMHACGHDVHMSIVLGTASVLSSLKDKISGNVKFIFQPAEEGLGGAKLMIDEGVLQNPNVDAIIAAHVDPNMKTGYISVRPGPVMASPSEFEIVIYGKGGHAAEPHKTINPIIIASDIVNTLQTVVKDEKDILKRAILSVTYFHAGTSYNIVPDCAIIRGTVRTFDINCSKNISWKIESIVASKTRKSGNNSSYTFKYDIGYPPVFNEAGTVEALIESSKKLLGPEHIITEKDPAMLAEDFAYYARLVPGAFFHLGCSDPNDEKIYNLHSSSFKIDEECIQTGMEIMSQFALDFLK